MLKKLKQRWEKASKQAEKKDLERRLLASCINNTMRSRKY